MEDDIISQFDKTELLSVLQKNDYHSPEISESDLGRSCQAEKISFTFMTIHGVQTQ